MMLNATSLRNRLATYFPDAEQVDEGVVRFTKSAGAEPYAVYYIDVADDLPTTQTQLSAYQERVVGARYFEGSRSLQWNNYLFFLTETASLELAEVRAAKELIERDRAYARKFVIPVESIDLALHLVDTAPIRAEPYSGIVPLWRELLGAGGLSEAILGDGDIPSRMRLIERETSSERVRTKKSPRLSTPRAGQFIRTFDLEEYRPYPRRQHFEFGQVNLIVGPNASGKTSLLEAIELFYCGRTRRNASSTKSYRITAVFSDGTRETAEHTRKPQVYRDRSLQWYGQHEVKTNHLNQRFAQFQFLDTDAAVRLGDSSDHLEQDLASLLVGPEAATAWSNLERVMDEVTRKVNGLRPAIAQLKAELGVHEKTIADMAGTPQASDAMWSRLQDILRSLSWTTDTGAKSATAKALIESLSELIPLLKQAAKIDWADAPVTLRGLHAYSLLAQSKKTQAENALAKLYTASQALNTLSATAAEADAAQVLLAEATRIIGAKVPARAARLAELESLQATQAGLIAGNEALALREVLAEEMGATFREWHARAMARRSHAERELTDANERYANFSRLRVESDNLGQQLRQVARRLMHIQAQPNHCPLCHTEFGEQQLEERMTAGVNHQLEILGQDLLIRKQEQEAALQRAVAIERQAIWLARFRQRVGISADAPLRSVWEQVDVAAARLASIERDVDNLKWEIADHESQDLSMARLKRIELELQALGHPLSDYSTGEVERLAAALEKAVVSASGSMKSCREEQQRLHRAIEDATGGMGVDVDSSLEAAFSQLSERLATTTALVVKLANCQASLPWPQERALGELLVDAEAVLNASVELQAATGRESLAMAACTHAGERRDALRAEVAERQALIGRLEKAAAKLKVVHSEHSLTAAMNDALKENRASIESIFGQIHSPREFSGLGSDWMSIVRKEDGREVTLREISTGQRAAFALSVFLAQNAQLRNAPPVVLIDDPVAYVDDLNALSFLDYLREVVVGGRRQLFFATANQKLASLFERKFDFLTESEFCRFDLAREHVR